MGKKSNVRKKTANSQVITNITEITPSADDKTVDTIPLYEATPKASEQTEESGEVTSSADNQTSLPEDIPTMSEQIAEASEIIPSTEDPTTGPGDASIVPEQKIVVTEITPSPEERIDDTIHEPEIVHTASEQKGLVVVSYHLPAVVSRTPQKNPIRSTVSASSKNDRRRRVLFIISTAIVLLFVATGLSYVVLGANAGNTVAPINNKRPLNAKAIVTLVPLNRVVKNTYMIEMVTSQPNIAQKQVEGVRTISDSQSQLLQVNATGNITTPATNATGTLTFSSPTKRITIPAGATFLDKNNIALVLNAPVTLRRLGGSTVSVGAHASPAGSKGNIPALDLNGVFCYPNCATGSTFHLQNTAFAGGRDPQSNTYVQQSDITNAASQLENSLTSAAQAAIQAQIKTTEQLMGSISCGLASFSSNQQAGDKVPNVTVSITETCSGEVYSVQPGLTLAANLLKQDLSTLSGPGYAIVGNATTQVLTQPELIDSQGTLLMKIMASGTAVYQFTPTEALAFAKLIAGKSPADAQALLLQQIGVAQATINFTGNSTNTLPADPSKIAFVVLK